MPAASMMRLASTAFSLTSARSTARRSAARGRPVDGGARPKLAIEAAYAQHARGTRSPCAGGVGG